MLGTMHKIGQNIRQYYSFVSEGTPVYLLIDNTGGHREVCRLFKEKNWNHMVNPILPRNKYVGSGDIGSSPILHRVLTQE